MLHVRMKLHNCRPHPPTHRHTSVIMYGIPASWIQYTQLLLYSCIDEWGDGPCGVDGWRSHTAYHRTLKIKSNTKCGIFLHSALLLRVSGGMQIMNSRDGSCDVFYTLLWPGYHPGNCVVTCGNTVTGMLPPLCRIFNCTIKRKVMRNSTH